MRSWLMRHIWFTLFVVVPVGLTTLYEGLLASDLYTSESRFVIKSPNDRRSDTSLLAGLVQAGGSSAGLEQTSEVLDYVRSRDALQGLQRAMDIRSRYAPKGADRLARFPGPFEENSFEGLFRYYRKMVAPRVDADTGMAVLVVKAFTPRDAQAINANLLSQSEQLVNRLNQRAQATGIAEAARRVAAAEGRVRTARIAMADYRNSKALLDPAKQASGVLDVSNKLVADHAALVAQLDLMQRETPLNPGIPALRARAAAVAAQIAAQEGRAVGTSSGIASKLADYEKLALEQEFAAQNLSAANASLEQARVQSQRQQFYLERVVEPNLPDMPEYPKRLRVILTVAGVSLCLYFVGWMLAIGIIEHAPRD